MVLNGNVIASTTITVEAIPTPTPTSTPVACPTPTDGSEGASSASSTNPVPPGNGGNGCPPSKPPKLDTPDVPSAVYGGYTRVDLSWPKVDNAGHYAVRYKRIGYMPDYATLPNAGATVSLSESGGTVTAVIKGLVNTSAFDYLFSVKAYAPPGTPPRFKDSDWSADKPFTLPTPVYALGHLPDHTLKYDVSIHRPPGQRPTLAPDPIDVINAVHAAAAGAWNGEFLSRPALDLLICKGSVCGTRNSDGATVTIKFIGDYNKPNTNIHCGIAIACYYVTGTHISWKLLTAEIRFEEPGWDTRPGANFRIIWTSVLSDDDEFANHVVYGAKWRYAYYELLHEFGHGLGLPHIGGIMNDRTAPITSGNLDYLERIYRGHSPGDPW